MAYCICRVQKYNKSNMKVVGNHHSRTKDSYTSNKDIDPSRTHKNMNWGKIAELKTAVWDQINKRAPMPEGKARRKDAVLCFEVLVTASPEFWPKDWQTMTTEEFKQTNGFQYLVEAYSLMKQRFGNDNYIGGSLHLDEATPHMSIMFVPITNDGKLCAKDILTRRVLRDLQTDIAEKVGKKYGLERGETDSDAKHLPTDEFKLSKELAKLKARFASEVTSLNNMIQSVIAENERWTMLHRLPPADKQKVFDYVTSLAQDQDQAADIAPH